MSEGAFCGRSACIRGRLIFPTNITYSFYTSSGPIASSPNVVVVCVIVLACKMSCVLAVVIQNCRALIIICMFASVHLSVSASGSNSFLMRCDGLPLLLPSMRRLPRQVEWMPRIRAAVFFGWWGSEHVARRGFRGSSRARQQRRTDRQHAGPTLWLWD